MGRPKAWLPLGEEFLLQRIARIVGEVVDPVVIVAAVGQELPGLPESVSVVCDRDVGRGPLAGLATGLAALHGRCEAVYLSSCDVPFLTSAFIRRVLDALGEAEIAVPEIGGYPHPLAGVYRMTVRATVERMLSENRLRLRDLLDGVRARRLPAEWFAEFGLESLENVNTPAEYDAALRKLPRPESFA
jgi:molybdopterin-guanine dinucleotide biosynthesis protein A